MKLFRFRGADVVLVGIAVAIFLLSASWRYQTAKAALLIQHDLRNDIYDTLQKRASAHEPSGFSFLRI